MLERCLAEQGDRRAAGRCCRTRSPALRDTDRPAVDRLHAATSAPMRVVVELAARPLRDYVSPSPAYRLLVERELALFGAWYEIFPRCEGATSTTRRAPLDASGTLRTAAERLPGHRRDGLRRRLPHPDPPDRPGRAQGPEQHPRRRPERPRQPLRHRLAGRRARRDPPRPRAPSTTSTPSSAELARTGWRSPWTSRCSAPPTTPGSRRHPEWFTTRADGTIAYAENPPKKYQDIYPLNFDNDPAGIYAEMRRVVQVWIDHGVTLFRVDNPHTKPVRVLAVAHRRRRPGPPRDHLAGRGVHQAGDDAQPGQGRLPAVVHLLRLAQHAVGAARSTCSELSGEAAAYMRPSFWPTTHDILTPYMQYGGPAAWKLRAALAATLVPTYGIYAGYELMENVAAAGCRGADRQREVRVQGPALGGLRAGRGQGGPEPDRRLPHQAQRDPPGAPGAALAAQHPVPPVDDENILVFSKSRRRRRPSTTRSSSSRTSTPTRPAGDVARPGHAGPRPGLGRAASAPATSSPSRRGSGEQHSYVRLGPETEPVHVIEVRSPLTPCRASHLSQPAGLRHDPRVVPDCRVLRGPRARVRRLARGRGRVTSRGLDRPAGLPAVAGGRLPVAAAVLRRPAARRRVRHLRLHRGAAGVRHPAGVHRARSSQAHARGIRIVTDLVMNHTSDQHPWFQASAAPSPDGPYGDFYVWSDTDDPYTDARIIFVDTEMSNWTFDPIRRQFFWHRFFSHQPDLNFENPRGPRGDVRRRPVLDGHGHRRVPARRRSPTSSRRRAPTARTSPGRTSSSPSCAPWSTPSTPAASCSPRPTSRPADVVDYFGTEEAPECQMCFHFPVMPMLYYALREEKAAPIIDVLADTPADPERAPSGAPSCATTTS